MNRYRIWHLSFAGLFLLQMILPGAAAAAEELSISQALDIALEKSPVLAAARNEEQAARARLTQARSAYWPQLDADAGTNTVWYNGDRTTDNYSTGLSVSQYLFDFGKTPALVDVSKQSLESFQMSLDSVRRTLIRDVKQAFYDVLKNQQLVHVGLENLDVRTQQLAQATALYRQGMRPKIDVTRGEVEVSQAQLSLITLRFGLQEAVIAFERLIGGPPTAGEYTFAEAPDASVSPPPLNELIDTALKIRPEIKGLNAQVKAAEASLLSAKRSVYPTLNARGSYFYDGSDLPLEDDTMQAGVYLTWSLFTGFRRSGLIRESLADLDNFKAQEENRRLTVTEEVSSAYFLLNTSIEAIKTAQIVLTQAQENLAIAQGRYKAGVSDSIELSDAQVLYTESRSALVQATYERQKALAGLEFAVGTRFDESTDGE